MIRVVKPRTVPKRLLENGAEQNAFNCAEYDKDSLKYDEEGFNIDNKIYGHKSVKKVLKNAQKNKCCFCEKDQVDEVGAVEHFRPKKGYKKEKKDKLEKPGYYWLAFEWDNLFFVCSACNSIEYKGNRFPLVNEFNRAKNHNGNYLLEEAFLLNPSGDGLKDPEKHITFNNEFPEGLSLYGKKTIEICGLDRDALNNMRKQLLDDIDARIAIIKLEDKHTRKDVEKAKKFLRNCQKKEAKFSSAAKAYLKKYNIIVT